ncbi:PQQ-dependent sugar dehydrogenase [Devosia sp. RR2S18]|uniref:PQQ-dependent sugar dehydrogenase n=1 Tax=Devosia rhizosphaerae TaxID=3049774 RepID=UPI00254119B1|nr:PQQ-dependent sugar dehydrogenase [Devosia sp. RR2S18]WIJ25634.1 PQQ-dependent sugar dehydrogenase [Devosia sp. RR2S18]
MRRVSALLAGTMITTALISAPALAQDGAGQPVQTAEPNVPSQEPAFEAQTRAPQPEELVEVDKEVVADSLPQLWAMEFLPDGRMLVTAKEGALHIIGEDGEASAPIENVPEVASSGQGGLLDVALAPDFEESNRIFFSFAEPREGGTGTSVARAELVMNESGGGSLENVEVIFQQMPTYDNDMHYGSRLAFGPEGALYVTVGERFDEETRVQAQELSSGLGKVFRITEDGEPVEGNPFIDQEDAVPEIWSYGHRNVQSAAIGPDGNLWTVEHGPQGGDELNQPQAGENYGWPVISYGQQYSGQPVGSGETAQEGMEQPVYYWDPVIAPSGMAYYEGDEFPTLDNAFLIGGLVAQAVVVVHMEDGRVAFEEWIPMEARVRDVEVGSDGAIYAVTENRDAGTSEIVRLTNAAQ